MKHEEYIGKIKKVPLKERDAYAYVLSTLPAIEMLIKLVERKQNGKKPFSDAFQYENSRKDIDEGKKEIYAFLDGEKNEVKSALEKLSDISLKAREEIKMESLRNDYLWISKTISLARSFLG